jgi:hypothetical protein
MDLCRFLSILSSMFSYLDSFSPSRRIYKLELLSSLTTLLFNPFVSPSSFCSKVDFFLIFCVNLKLKQCVSTQNKRKIQCESSGSLSDFFGW